MKTLYVDFETYYAADYSLSKMQTDGYILDPRFEVIGVSVAVDNGFPVWFSGNKAQTLDWLQQFDWASYAVCCQNTLFDGFILTQVFGIKPKLWMDTLPMGRMLYPYLKSHSLAKLAEHMGLGVKGNEVLAALGKRRADFSPSELHAYGEYCKNDTALCRALCLVMLPHVPPIELAQIDMTIRMFTEPVFVGNIPGLEREYATEIERKRELLEAAAIEKVDIMSSAKFAEKLIELGVSPPTKISPTTGKDVFAFAKSDKAFTDLQEHDDPQVQALVAARLGVKTTIAETRVLTMMEAAKRGPMPVYLNFWGAKTTGRLSGGNRMNWQNLPARGPSAGIRDHIEAPTGHILVVGDSSNIELRVAMVAAGQLDVVAKIEAGMDLYCDFASKLFGRVVTKTDKKERMIGKIAMLSLQYGAGWARFKEMVRIESNKTGTPIILTDDEARAAVDLYRSVHGMVMQAHEWCGGPILNDIANGCKNLMPVDKNAWSITSNEGYGVGCAAGVKYHNLRRAQVKRDGKLETSWVYDMGRETVKIYGGKCVDGSALVLTELGWKPLRDIGDERVHDGVEFVHHSGTVFKGVKECIEVDAVLMTPEHKVLTNEGWRLASQSPRLYRPDLRGTVGDTAQPQRRKENALAFSMYLRETHGKSRHRSDEGGKAWRAPELRVPNSRPYVQRKHEAWDERAPSLRRLAVYARQVPASVASGVGKLWRTGHNSVQALAAVVREFLGGHGGNIPARAYARSAGQQPGVFPPQLCVANVFRSSEQPEEQRTYRYTAGADDTEGSLGSIRGAAHNAYVQGKERVASKASIPTSREVYDLVNCGPRHRFVVLGENGPFIAHNCFENLCQYLAGRIVLWQTARINSRYKVALSVHDEAVCVVKEEDEADARAYMHESLSLAPLWCRGQIPLACEIGVGKTYSGAK